MEIFSTETKFKFVKHDKIAFSLSALLILASLGSFLFQGLNFGIDFAGGALTQLKFEKPVALKDLRNGLADLDLGDMVVQEFGSPDEVLVRVEAKPDMAEEERAQIAKKVVTALEKTVEGKIDIRRVEFVGPQVGDELTQQGVMAVIYSMIAILIYVAWRFELRFAYGAVLALIHDITLTLGVFSLLQKEFTLVVVAALLTVIGYSLNDTIVVYDRIREEMKRLKNSPIETIIDVAVNRTLARTLVTSLTTLLVLTALLLFGGEVIFDFAFTLFMGVLIGTYSSIFVASPMVLLLDRQSKKSAPGGAASKETA